MYLLVLAEQQPRTEEIEQDLFECRACHKNGDNSVNFSSISLLLSGRPQVSTLYVRINVYGGKAAFESANRVENRDITRMC